VIEGGLGSDQLNGLGGVDTLKAKDGVADEISCAGGIDTLFADLALDTFGPDCENVS
jgi:hypothetical protein